MGLTRAEKFEDLATAPECNVKPFVFIGFKTISEHAKGGTFWADQGLEMEGFG